MGGVFCVDINWSPLMDNPFSSDGSYGSGWSSFIYDDTVENYTNIYNNTRVYCLRVNRSRDEGFVKLVDFIRYETGYERNVIVKIPKDVYEKVKNLVEDNSKDDVRSFRKSDVRYMVHSTSKESYSHIKKAKALLSPSELKKAGINVGEIGLKRLLEPKDYSDYIMLDILNGCGELVVNSRNLGYVCVDPDMEYEPGVRMYFDAYEIIRDGLAVRDGLHLLKVKDKLNLKKYMVAVISKEKLPKREIWTPSTFTEEANKYFIENYI